MDAIVWDIPNCSGIGRGQYQGQRGGHCGHAQQEARQLVQQPFICCHCGATGRITHGPYAPTIPVAPRR